MRRNVILVSVLVLILSITVGVQAADVSGEFTSELRVLTKEDKPLKDAMASVGVSVDVEGDLGLDGSWRLALDTSLDKALTASR